MSDLLMNYRKCGKVPELPNRYASGHKICNACRSVATMAIKERQKNREISKLINWRVALVIAYGIFSHDIVDGRNRICIYKSVYGSHAMTISATYMCPISQEFEV